VEEDLPDPLSPSGASILLEPAAASIVSGRSPVLDGETEAGFAVARGLVIHKLLQMLPNIPERQRQTAACRYLDRAASRWPAAEKDAAWRQVRDILGDARFAPLFSPTSRAEVSVMGEVDVRGRKRTVSGKIDRLAVTDDAVLILDYKSNRPAPVTLADVPAAYVLQLALYGALLTPLYPGLRISAALLFTEAPRLIVVPEAALAGALVRLTHA
jgi:ATP-dependent helicase/nuclease subunit A